MSKPPGTRGHLSQHEFADRCDEVLLLKKELQQNYRKLEALLGTSALVNAGTKEISDYVLASIVRLTGSSYGFLGFVDQDESVMTIFSWSGDAMSDCSMVDRPTDFCVARAGVWAEAVRNRRALILNDYSLKHPGKKGLPEGHVALERLLVLPVFRGEKIETIVAVANRDEDYTERDVAELSAFLKNIQVILDNQRVRESLRVSEERYRLINDASRDFIYSYDREGRFTFANGYLCERLHMTLDEVVGKNHLELGLPKEMCEEPDVLLKQVLQTGRPAARVVSCLMPDGKLHYYEVILGSLHDETGEIVGICGTTRDFTELQRVRREKDELEEKYFQAQKMESVGRLAGGIAHDLNNMLSPVLGYADLIASDLKTGAVQPHMVDKIIGGARRARDLVYQLLAFSRQQVMEFRPVVFDEMIADFEPLLRRALREDIVLALDLKAHNTHVLGDPEQLEKVIMNLAVNAQDAMPQGGSLTVTTSIEQNDGGRSPVFEELKPGRFVVMTVQDTGHGMEEKVLGKLFEPFFTTKEVGQGTGLGLAMAWGIVKQHSGCLWVSSETGRGSVFKIALPVHDGVG